MIKKLLLQVICFLTFAFANAQLNSVAIVGAGTVTGWPNGSVNEVDAQQMTTTDGVNWTILNLILSNNDVKFRGNNSWALPYNWGGTSFPSGQAIVDGGGIKPNAGVYNVTFNSNTLTYQFTKIAEQVISIIGTATPGDWNVDTDMTTTDGNIYTLNNVSLKAGALKFRSDHVWNSTTNWGGNNFPSGNGLVDGAAITVPANGVYSIVFNKTTLAYNFTSTLSVKDFDAVTFKAYPNPTQNSWIFDSSKEKITSIQIVDSTGKTVKTVTPDDNKITLDASNLNDGIYFAKVTTATAVQTLKLVKQ